MKKLLVLFLLLLLPLALAQEEQISINLDTPLGLTEVIKVELPDRADYVEGSIMSNGPGDAIATQKDRQLVIAASQATQITYKITNLQADKLESKIYTLDNKEVAPLIETSANKYTAIPQEAKVSTTAAEEDSQKDKFSINMILTIVLIIMVGVVGYFVYALKFRKSATQIR